MIPAVLYAVPAFLLLIVMEVLSFRFLPDDEERGYEARDTATSLSMGVGSQIIGVPWKLFTAVLFAGLYVLSPVKLDPHDWWVWVLLFFADDFAYYWFHRLHHEVRLLWAGHVVHHSSQYFNFSTALRQSWTPMTSLPFWLGLAALGFPPWMIFLQQSISLAYQFFLHTERIDRLPRPIEWFFNTPSHHRVHHGSNDPYLDRNYGGILIVWDRLFGSFEPEGERVSYGLTTNLQTFNPLKVATHEYAAIWRDVRAATSWRHRAGFLFGRPGWQPAA
ncbi:sterol desaturase/sphingolipid hydroxylase (fatty acid hydroxylase superfamily) [Actinoplanes campanulatus]|uniref:Sterol desaturase/sphingolipid hydroxylase (Fatty acid hydroxylase superfamily) n=1 Tax=Actinoplanes campanulatus TaxID=113559 RepID=A0A7W5AKH6_9ACTN|nr:sterol desaturase family protein [Actinoplanes campanulatus]MBB3097966.1 sterol desaturase/sphingolipid hydroxylase (fatty acid hydroxylase superfamily) [Actinoplanes campanulatus]GGN31645.1 C-5 sterol desaturase [Actinoplanes campanulatus]GID41353.1 C-5 sterol desaturase [Actinoplanes campanulatus]